MIQLKSLKKAAVISFFLNIFFISPYLFASIKDEVVLSLIINGEKIGDSFCIIEDGKIFIPLESLKEAKLRKIGGISFNIAGKEYIDLKSWEEVNFELNEEKLELNLTIPPEYLPVNIINLYPQRRQNVIIPEQNSVFLNYRFDYSNVEGVRDLFINHELGIRLNKLSFLTNGYYFDNTNKYTRLDTAIYFDDRKTLNRFVIGDFVTPSSPTTSGNKMIGISYFKKFNIDPYFIYKPTFDIRTFANFRSEVEIYLDDTLFRKEFVPPGEINMLDLYYYGGRKDIKILIKDPFGRTELISYPLYFTDIMLKKGMRDFNYSIGFLREDYGTVSNKYTNLGISVFERFGYTEYLNIGGQFVSVPSKDFYNISGETNFLLSHYGVLGLLGSYSYLNDKSGFALMGSYSYNKKNIGFRTTGFYTWDNFSSTYINLNEEAKKSFSIGTTYYISSLGSFSFDYIHNKYKNSEKNSINFGYTKSFKGRINLFANLTKRFEENNDTEFFIGISIYPKREYTASARLEDTRGRTSEVVQFSKSVPIGEGYGYRINLEKEKANATSNNINTYLQYRTAHGVLEIDGFFKDSREKLYENTRLAYSGAIAFMGNKIGIIRPINDSFALVKVSDVPEVRVDVNGQMIGRTDKRGYIFVPEVNSYYDNLFTINDKDIPIEYDIITKEVAVSPWYRSGFCLSFPVKRVYRYSGFLIANYLDSGEKKPLEFHEIIIENTHQDKEQNSCIAFADEKQEKEIKINTGKNGEFYIESLKPGIYKAKLKIGGIVKEIDLVLIDSKDTIINLGNVEIPLQSSQKQKTIFNLPEDDRNIKEKSIIEKIVPFEEPVDKTPSMLKAKKDTTTLLDFNNSKPLIHKIYFKFNSTRLSSKSDIKTLMEVIHYLKNNKPAYVKIIVGHCDQLGSRKYNYKLGLRRAKFVKKYLTKHGIPTERIKEVVSYGRDLPACQNLNESCRKLNRRVEIHIINDKIE